ncbi:MAG: Eco57I restriction-modification methylase domain-containing protein, partial [Candidatus Saccharimonadales bacterium]
PYIRQELIKDKKPRLKEVFGPLFSGTADLYVFFYLRGLQLLRPGGMLVFISSNKWFRAGYGVKLRAHIAKTTTVQTILDFHDLPVFEAIAYPMIFVSKKEEPPATHTAILAEPPDLEAPYPDVREVVAKYGHAMPKTALGRDGTWHLATSGSVDHLAKMRKAGPTLAEFSGGRVYRGLTTGLNEAFVIDNEMRDQLLASNPTASEIIKPFVAGKDVKRWRLPDVSRWIIVTRIGVDMKRYPAVMRHLRSYESALIERDDQGEHWWELRSCRYYEDFEKPKIVSTKVSVEPTFALDRNCSYLGNTAYFIKVQNDSLFVLGVLNSAASKYYASIAFVGKQNGWYEVQP